MGLIGDVQYSRKIANVSYMYNYDGAPHFGYYWIDSYPNSLISNIPEDREEQALSLKAGFVNQNSFIDGILVRI